VPRQRMIKPEFLSSETMGRLSFPARLAYVGSWMLADDEGKCRGALPYLQGQIFPFEETRIDMAKIRDRLAEAERWFVYQVGGMSYIWLPRFWAHQTINRPYRSSIPDPPQEAIVAASERVQEWHARWIAWRKMQEWEVRKGEERRGIRNAECVVRNEAEGESEESWNGENNGLAHSVNDSVSHSRSNTKSKTKSKSDSALARGRPKPKRNTGMRNAECGAEAPVQGDLLEAAGELTAAGATTWDLALAKLRGTMDRESFATWLMPLRCLRLDGARGEVVLGVPSEFCRHWIERDYGTAIRETLSEITAAGAEGRAWEVEYRIVGD